MTKDIIEELVNILGEDRVLENEPLSSHCSFRVGGPADLFLRVKNTEELSRTAAVLKKAGIESFLLGKGTNLLIGDKGYRGAVITMTGTGKAEVNGSERSFRSLNVEGNLLRAGAGVTDLEAANAARDHGLTGLEFAAGIPGTIGGGIVMNAGAYDGEMKQVVREVTIMYPDGTCRTLSGEEMEFGYRTSIMKKIDAIVVEAVFELQPGDPDAITAKMADLANRRKEKQPLEYPSAGSTFKRPEGMFAGKLIMDAGLRGYTVGGAQVAEKHCGFVINRGGATAADISKLIRDVQNIVMEDAGVMLEKEVICLGEF